MTFRRHRGNWKLYRYTPGQYEPVTTDINPPVTPGRCFRHQIITSENPTEFRVERRLGAESTIGAAARTTQKHFQQSLAIAHTSPADSRQQATASAAVVRRAEETLEKSHATQEIAGEPESPGRLGEAEIKVADAQGEPEIEKPDTAEERRFVQEKC